MTATRAVSATFWSVVDILLRQGVQFAISVVLARLLLPSDYGTVALLALFVGVAGVLAEGGMSSALIQRPDVADDDLSTVFWFNLSAATIGAAVLWLIAPAIAALFDKPVLEPLARAMGVNLIVATCGSIQQALFTRRLDFRPVTIASVVSMLLSGGVAIGAAWHGFGVWALAAQTLTASAATTLMLWQQSRWRPKPIISLASARRLFGFGGYMLASALLDVAFNQGYTLIIGRLYGAGEVGLYGRGQSTAQLPSTMLNSIISRVAFPLFSRAVSREQLSETMQFSVQTTMLINAPTMLGLAAVADPFVLTAFGEPWRPCVPILQILCISGLLMPLHVINLQALIALGCSNLFFRLELVKKSVGLLALLVAAREGATGIAWAMLIASFFAYYVNAFYSHRLTGYGLLRQIGDVTPSVGSALAMACAVLVVHPFLFGFSPFQRLVVEILIGAVVFPALAVILNLPGYRDLRDLLLTSYQSRLALRATKNRA
ncbi:MAG: lipopolysaccharide biosynthesis protein [Methylocystis sp.]|uniref:lipopolysaccharide biosynthesis protein n=1 Tax=Methylocystis sp. TaxID=1911079 RepID=UPI003DA43C09